MAAFRSPAAVWSLSAAEDVLDRTRPLCYILKPYREVLLWQRKFSNIRVTRFREKTT